MTDARLIGYCETHCRTERALFSAADIERMFALAGKEPPQLGGGFYSMHEEMATLCKEARSRIAKRLPPWRECSLVERLLEFEPELKATMKKIDQERRRQRAFLDGLKSSGT